MKKRASLTTISATAAAIALVLAGCSTAATGSTTASGTTSVTSVSLAADDGSFFDSSTVHSIEILVDEAEVEAMIQTYLDTGEKEWLEADVVIDGVTYESVGIKLKGNSSLQGVTLDTPITDLPWRIRTDKYVDDQSIEGVTDIVVRSNNTESSLNEAVALEMLSYAGLATEESSATRFSINGSEEDLRLTVAVPNDSWLERNAEAGLLPSSDGILYKAESGYDYSWLGEDGDLYTEAFDLEEGEEDYQPLVDFLDVVNNTTDEEFAEQLPEVLDVDSFARYLALEDLIDNFDDIDGPGNNSYLYYDPASGQMTVVAWDHNLAFGVQNGGGQPGEMGGAPGERGGVPGGRGAAPGAAGELPEGVAEGELPEGVAEGELPEGVAEGELPARPGGAPGGVPGDAAGGGFGGGAQSGNNQLTTRFLENEEFAALYEEALADLQAELYDSGLLEETVDSWVDVLTAGASDLIDTTTLQSESESILGYATSEVQARTSETREETGAADPGATA
ncbi:CotH kinase family protein [Serinibacter salmoneus]|uniref:Spore coat protein CotH n=1 Tax=Serinibacter salmoneus TaxID=556530 RepID=A0A2A9D547_9MICO|nr:CotH kinase family protein [Serinibacter salmoneus]PFG20980.1 spore coat protein CotH [Serinibacter salmoneus]